MICVMGRQLPRFTYVCSNVFENSHTRSFAAIFIFELGGLCFPDGDRNCTENRKACICSRIPVDSCCLFLSQEYLAAALNHLELDDRIRDGHDGDRAKDIKGIWVASDSQQAVKEVRALAPEYFPDVPQEAIVWISGSDGGAVTTHSKIEVRIICNLEYERAHYNHRRGDDFSYVNSSSLIFVCPSLGFLLAKVVCHPPVVAADDDVREKLSVKLPCWISTITVRRRVRVPTSCIGLRFSSCRPRACRKCLANVGSST